MGVLTGFATVLFIILCVLLIIVILLQSDKGAGLGVFGGSSQSAFGSSTADVITKITAVMVALFLFGSLGVSALQSMKNVKMSSLDAGISTSDLSPAGVINEKPADKKDSVPAGQK